MNNIWTCPRGCDAEMEYKGVSDGYGMYGCSCCDVYECPACGEQEVDNCFNCEDDEEFGTTEQQLEEHNRNNE
jgi:hypothetical protein